MFRVYNEEGIKMYHNQKQEAKLSTNVTLTVFSLIITKYSFRKILLHAERHARYISINRLMEDSHAILMLISGCH